MDQTSRPQPPFEEKFKEAGLLLQLPSRDLFSLKLRPINIEGKQLYVFPDDYAEVFALVDQLAILSTGQGTVGRGLARRYSAGQRAGFLIVQHETGPEIILALAATTALGGLIAHTVERVLNVLRENNQHRARGYNIERMSVEIRTCDRTTVLMTMPIPPKGQPIVIDLSGIGSLIVGLFPTESEKDAYMSGDCPIDFAILTAIEVERKAVCEAFGLTDDHRAKRDSRVYWRGKLPLKHGQAYEVVVAQAPDAANIDAALLTNDLLHHWKPGAALFVGIAASTKPDEVRLGDIVLGNYVYYYERGKVTPTGTKPEPKMIPADSTLWNNVTTVPTWRSALPVPRPDGTGDHPSVHQGVIASGEKVLAEEGARDQIAAGHRKISAIEMEGYGFSSAAWQSFERVRHLVIRGICDDGSPTKDDRWHPYAAAAVAAFAKHFLTDQPLAPRSQVANEPPKV